MAMQQQYDLRQARKAVKLGKVRRLVPQRKAVMASSSPKVSNTRAIYGIARKAFERPPLILSSILTTDKFC